MNDNRGFSLIELIVVMSIIAIMTGVLSMGVSTMFSRDAERAATVINDELSQVRMNSMSKPGNYEMVLHGSSDGKSNYIEVKNDKDASLNEIINIDRPVIIDCGVSGSESLLDGSVTIVFDKANGSVAKIDGIAPTSDMYIIKCTAVKNSDKTAVVKLMPVTGRHEMKIE